MALEYKKHKCEVCEKDFSGPKASSYLCPEQNDENHVVESKAYYVASDGLIVSYLKGKQVPSGNDQLITIEPEKSLVFSRGTYKTSDPREQDFLDRHKGMITREAWELIHITPAQRLKETERKADDLSATVASQNEELARLRKELGAKKDK